MLQMRPVQRLPAMADATASGEESSDTESQPQETPGEAVLTGASTYGPARIEREQIQLPE